MEKLKWKNNILNNFMLVKLHSFKINDAPHFQSKSFSEICVMLQGSMGGDCKMYMHVSKLYNSSHLDSWLTSID